MIIKDLLKEGVCFAVMQSYSYLTKQKIASEKEWEIIALKRDFKALSQYSFLRKDNYHYATRHRNPEGIISRTMTLEETHEFLRYLDDFNVHDMGAAGKIYDLKHKPLNDEYAKQEYKTQVLSTPCFEA
ncbi:hypothetical protein [Ornithobacterium rhinotracheale]